ncbi:MAG: endonuclease/exonuclease/phosphatase family protein [Casimicrobiaceae bacterium]
MTSSSLTVATYNIHDAVGSDHRFAPERIAAVLAEIGADLFALQEVGAARDGVDTLALLRDATGFHAVPESAHCGGTGAYGNCLLSRHPVAESKRIDLTVAPRQARGALDAVVDCAGSPLRVLATHLGLRPAERRAQVRGLLKTLEAETPHPTLLLGDLNEWFLWGRPLRWLHAHFQATPSPASFPARAPLLALDRIWVEPRALLQGLWVHTGPAARAASDHLPVVAELKLP